MQLTNVRVFLTKTGNFNDGKCLDFLFNNMLLTVNATCVADGYLVW